MAHMPRHTLRPAEQASGNQLANLIKPIMHPSALGY
jgi:hypothetical protein